MKYPVLSSINVLLKVMAWILAPIGLMGALIACVLLWGSREWWVGLAAGAGGVFVTVICCVSLYAASELARLLVDIERNTRDAAEGLRQNSDYPYP
jgi:membrane protein YdbS with pleckstrin-like domain